jgi:hypothetical protein
MTDPISSIFRVDGNQPMDGLEIWEGKAENEWSGQVKIYDYCIAQLHLCYFCSSNFPCVTDNRANNRFNHMRDWRLLVPSHFQESIAGIEI